MPKTIVGIDLGTTNSLCAVFKDSTPQLLKNVHGDYLTPSVVGVMDDGQVLVGAPARELRVTHPEKCCSCFKRWMGTEHDVVLNGRNFNPIELSSLVLRSLKDDAESSLNETIQHAVITVPAYFNDNQRKATKQAGEMAGLKVSRIINEPTAAALTYGFHDREAEKHLIVIDLGGGTFDVTLMEIFEGTLEIISTAGESMLGGEDFTDRLVAVVLKKQGLHLETAEMKHPVMVARLREECDLAKKALAEAGIAEIRNPKADGSIDPEAKAIKINQDSFASICSKLIERLKGPINRAIRDGRMTPESIDEVILVGGATRMPILKNFVKEHFGKSPKTNFDPDQVVALGAAVQAALINDDDAVDDMVMTDVCPFTLGIEITKEFGGQLSTGYYEPLIHRNTTIPVSKEKEFYTIEAGQTAVELRVFQGEARKVDDNLELGKLWVEGIPPGPSGQPFRVRFTYDMNGILEVEAIIPQTGKRFQLVLTQHAKSLTESEIQEAVAKMKEIKFYPRDDAQNQRLVLFCERMVGEISQYERGQLEEAIDAFEHAMSSGEREFFDTARQNLMMVLSALGIEYKSNDD